MLETAIKQHEAGDPLPITALLLAGLHPRDITTEQLCRIQRAHEKFPMIPRGVDAAMELFVRKEPVTLQ